MNLSSYLQMPPAPNVPSSTPSLTPQGARTGASPSAAGNMGFDFAQVMARQIQRLVPQERQNLAADAPKNPEPQAREPENARPAEDRQTTERSDAHASPDRNKREVEPTDSHDQDQDQPAAHVRQRARAVKTAKAEDNTLLAGLMPGATANPVITGAEDLAASDKASGNVADKASLPLQTIELSPQVRIITDPQKAPSPESLAAFAKSMGLDESAIQNLLGQPLDAPASALAPTTTQALPSGVPTPSLNLPTALTGLPQMPSPNGDSPNAQAILAAISTPTEIVISGAGLAQSATTLLSSTASTPGLSATDMAAIQQVQITVLPAAVLPINTAHINAVPSTLDMLSLLGSGVDEQDVTALLTRFSEEAGSGDSQAEHSDAQSEGHGFSNFAQALGRNAATPAPTQTAQATAPNMSEVYDQLSEKMATELAARMHKQLSDGEWKMKFGLRPANLGGVEIQLEMKDGKLDAVFHADNPLTRDLLQNSSQRLREALGNFGINAGQVQVGQGGGQAQQNASGNSGKRPQVRDNSISQVNGTDNTSSVTSARNKANASLLDLYA